MTKQLHHRDMPVFALLLAIGLCAALLLSINAAAFAAKAEVTWDLPFKANDLSGNEYYYRGKKIHSDDPKHTQYYGFDLGARVFDPDSKTWSSITKSWADYDKNPKNGDFVVYGKPVYAMADGTIVGCWRNAPENPRPIKAGEDPEAPRAERDWWHPMLIARRIPGGGNMLWVERADGTRTLYAHFRPGSMPAALCPHEAEIFPYKPGEESDFVGLEESEQIEIKKGDYLGRVGNAGSSTGPHLHIHVERNGKPEKLNFNHGLATANKDSKADTGNWTKFKGNPIPPGPVLFWPPRKREGQYARHGLPASSFQRYFDHLADSGFWPTWLDLYSAGGREYINMVWEPAEGAWRAYAGITGNAFQQAFDKNVAENYHPVLSDVGLWDGQPRYAAIFIRNKPGQFRLRFGIDDKAAQQEFDSSTSKGFRPVSASVVSLNGNRRNTVLYRKDDVGSYWMKTALTPSGYQQAYNENRSAGRQPRFIDVYEHNGQTYFSAIFTSKPAGTISARHGLTASGYQSAFNGAMQQGYNTVVVAAYDGNANHRFAGVWHKPPAPKRAAVTQVAPKRAPLQAPRRSATTRGSQSDAPARATLSADAVQSAQSAPGAMTVQKQIELGSSEEQGGDLYARERTPNRIQRAVPADRAPLRRLRKTDD